MSEREREAPGRKGGGIEGGKGYRKLTERDLSVVLSGKRLTKRVSFLVFFLLLSTLPLTCCLLFWRN